MMDANTNTFGPLAHQTMAWVEISTVSLMAPYKIAP